MKFEKYNKREQITAETLETLKKEMEANKPFLYDLKKDMKKLKLQKESNSVTMKTLEPIARFADNFEDLIKLVTSQ